MPIKKSTLFFYSLPNFEREFSSDSSLVFAFPSNVSEINNPTKISHQDLLIIRCADLLCDSMQKSLFTFPFCFLPSS